MVKENLISINDMKRREIKGIIRTNKLKENVISIVL